MANPTIEISKQQVVNALLQFRPKELKNILNTLFKQKTVYTTLTQRDHKRSFIDCEE
jgi:hypothetical protein